MKDGINALHLLAARGALQLEMKGMRHSRFRSIRKAWTIYLGIPGKSSCLDVIRKIEEKLLKEYGHDVTKRA